ncbi:MAG TPA: hypothetical protein VLH79_16260 [Chthonomonadales bacterium]|nr:hypothetical protein [Chthonomonadales bacterium]
MTFSPAWHHARFGMRFGERYHRDPIHRTEQDREAARLLWDTFGDAGLGEADPPPRPHLAIAGRRFLPALFGCEIVFLEDQAPANRHLPIADPERLPALPRPDLQTNPWAVEYRRQARVLLDRWGAVDAAIDHGGPLHVVSSVFGAAAYLGLADDRREVLDALRLAAETAVETYDRLMRPLNPWLPADRDLWLGNCSVPMVSPRSYARQVLPADLIVRRAAARLSLQHCGVIDRYLEAYRTLEPLERLHLGWNSDIAAARRTFPATPMDLLMSAYDVYGMDEQGLRDTAALMAEAAAPLCLVGGVWMADVGPDVPDDTVRAFVRVVNEELARAS